MSKFLSRNFLVFYKKLDIYYLARPLLNKLMSEALFVAGVCNIIDETDV